MQIIVDRFNETIFEGDADDFLFENDNDADLEMALNDLEEQKVGTSIKLYDSNGNVIIITKGTLYID